MASRKSPLRDRLLSNSPDPLKSSILRESGMGWNPSPGSTDPVTSPLRIAKRDSPKPRGPVLARRTSSSYRHVHTNNLVSKSPFKSKIPTPSTPSSCPIPIPLPTRRVSGEKRPRPSSMHEQAEVENDRPFALKRERKQSKTFRELVQKEPVTNSPFKNLQPGTQSGTLSSPPPMTLSHDPPRATSTSPANFHMHVPATIPNAQPSPRSALVSRRMHGPRSSGGPRRERRKVTFFECCDVLEYERESESEEEDAFRSCDDGERDDPDEDESEVPPTNHSDSFLSHDSLHERDEPMESYESIELSDAGFNPTVPSLLSDPDTSITGIVDEMFANVKPSTLSDDVDGPTTPPRLQNLPTDLETEDGIPIGRSHHVERFLQQHRPHQFSPFSSPRHSSSGYQSTLSADESPATPPRRSPIVRHSTPPLGRSIHLDRVDQGQEGEEDETLDYDVDELPASPSPMKKLLPSTPLEEGSITSFDLKPDNIPVSFSDMTHTDPLTPRIQDEPFPSQIERQNLNVIQDSMEAANLSVSNSDADISESWSKSSGQETNLEVPREARNNQEKSRQSSPTLNIFQSTLSRRFGSPSSRSASPLLGGRNEVSIHSSSPGRERISRDEIQRRLVNQRQQNNSSPAQDLASSTNSPYLVPSEDSLRPTCDSPTDAGVKEENRLSVLTTQTDFSTETAIVETAEKKILGLCTPRPSADKELGLLGSPQLEMDFGSKFSLGGFGPTVHTETKTNLPTSFEADKATSKNEAYESNSGMKMGDVDVDMDMKSALDRLMEDVAEAGGRPDDSMTTDDYDESFDRSQSVTHEDSPIPLSARPKVLERAATDSAFLQHSEAVESRNVSGSSTITEAPPPVPPKDDRAVREELVLQSRRRARAREREEDESDMISRRNLDRQSLGYGRPIRRRSMSTGDAEVFAGGAKKRGEALLDIVGETDQHDPLADSIEKALRKLAEASGDQKKGRYHVREREGTIYASSSDEKISHMAGAGDLDAGRAWRMVRRPSDMNEYAKQIKEYRTQDKSKAYGKVFVKVVAVRGLNLPIPVEHTAITCTLNNGIHFVTTPECDLSRDCRINQEFELIEHGKLEFTLTFKVRRDSHIIAQYKALTPVAPVPIPVPLNAPPPVAPSKSYGMRNFFSSSPKKSSKEKMAPPLPRPPQLPQPQLQPVRLIENLARYLKPDGTVARAFIKFKDVAGRCDTRLFETRYPLIGQRVESGGKYSTLEVGGVVLQMFRLPPLPGLPQDQLPQSLDECHRGLRHINWHKVTYFQGTLTQNGGDCSTWRRRQLRITGSNLIAFNDVTKRATATIDLKKAIDVKDNEDSRHSPDEYDGLCGVERSFRLIFPQDQEIIFFADTEEEKAKWLEVLRALVGHIPPYPLWGELLWQRQEEIAKRMQAAQQTISQQC